MKSASAAFFGKSAAAQVEELFRTHVADRGAVVARHVVLVAQDYRHGLVVHALARDQHGLAFGALGALASVHEVDRAAQHLLRAPGEHAVRIHVRDRLAAALADDVVEVARLRGAREVARVDIHARAVPAQVCGKAGHGMGAAEHHVAHGHAGALVEHVAGVVERREGIARGDVDGDVHTCVRSGEDAQLGADEAERLACGGVGAFGGGGVGAGGRGSCRRVRARLILTNAVERDREVERRRACRSHDVDACRCGNRPARR